MRTSAKKAQSQSQKRSSEKKSKSSKQLSNQPLQQQYDQQLSNPQGQYEGVDDQYYYSNYDPNLVSQNELTSQGQNPAMIYEQYPDMNQLQPYPQIDDQQYSAYTQPLQMDQDGNYYYTGGMEMMGSSGQPIQQFPYYEPESGQYVMDYPINFYQPQHHPGMVQFADMGGSITDNGLSLSSTGQQNYQLDYPMMVQGSMQYPAYNEFIEPDSSQKPFILNNQQSFVQQDGIVDPTNRMTMQGGTPTSYGDLAIQRYPSMPGQEIGNFEEMMKCNEDLLQSTDRMLDPGLLPSLPRSDAAARMIQRQEQMDIQQNEEEQDFNLKINESPKRSFKPLLTKDQDINYLIESQSPVPNLTDDNSFTGIKPIFNLGQSSKFSGADFSNSRQSNQQLNNFITDGEIQPQTEHQIVDRQTFGEPDQAINQSRNTIKTEKSIGQQSKKPPKPLLQKREAPVTPERPTEVRSESTRQRIKGSAGSKKEFRLRTENSVNRQQNMERVRQNSAKSRRGSISQVSHKLHSNKNSVHSMKQQSANSTAGRLKKNIELSSSKNQFQSLQAQQPATSRSQIDQPVPFTPSREQQLSPRGSPGTEQNFHEDESASPNFNFLNKANNPFQDQQISIGDQRYEESPISVRQMEVPAPLSQDDANIIKMQGVVDEPAPATVMSEANTRGEPQSETNIPPNRLSQSADAVDNSAATDPARKEDGRREAAELKPIQDIRESGPGNKSTQSHNSQRVQENEPHAADSSNLPNQDSLVNSSARQVLGQVQLPAHPNTDPSELGEDGRQLQAVPVERARTVMQPSSGETQSQFNENDSPRPHPKSQTSKPSLPPRDSIHSQRPGTVDESNPNGLSPQFAINAASTLNGQTLNLNQQELNLNQPAHSDNHRGTSLRSPRSYTQQDQNVIQTGEVGLAGGAPITGAELGSIEQVDQASQLSVTARSINPFGQASPNTGSKEDLSKAEKLAGEEAEQKKPTVGGEKIDLMAQWNEKREPGPSPAYWPPTSDAQKQVTPRQPDIIPSSLEVPADIQISTLPETNGTVGSGLINPAEAGQDLQQATAEEISPLKMAEQQLPALTEAKVEVIERDPVSSGIAANDHQSQRAVTTGLEQEDQAPVEIQSIGRGTVERQEVNSTGSHGPQGLQSLVESARGSHQGPPSVRSGHRAPTVQEIQAEHAHQELDDLAREAELFLQPENTAQPQVPAPTVTEQHDQFLSHQLIQVSQRMTPREHAPVSEEEERAAAMGTTFGEHANQATDKQAALEYSKDTAVAAGAVRESQRLSLAEAKQEQEELQELEKGIKSDLYEILNRQEEPEKIHSPLEDLIQPPLESLQFSEELTYEFSLPQATASEIVEDAAVPSQPASKEAMLFENIFEQFQQESQGVSSIFSPAYNLQEMATEMTKDSSGLMGQSNHASFLEEKVAFQEYKDIENSFLIPQVQQKFLYRERQNLTQLKMKSFNDVMTFREQVDSKWNPVESHSQDQQENYYGDESGEDKSESNGFKYQKTRMFHQQIESFSLEFLLVDFQPTSKLNLDQKLDNSLWKQIDNQKNDVDQINKMSLIREHVFEKEVNDRMKKQVSVEQEEYGIELLDQPINNTPAGYDQQTIIQGFQMKSLILPPTSPRIESPAYTKQETIKMFKQSKSQGVKSLSARKPRKVQHLNFQAAAYCMPMPTGAFQKLAIKKYSKSPRAHHHLSGCLLPLSKTRMSSPQPLNKTPRYKQTQTWKSKQNKNQSKQSNQRESIGKQSNQGIQVRPFQLKDNKKELVTGFQQIVEQVGDEDEQIKSKNLDVGQSEILSSGSFEYDEEDEESDLFADSQISDYSNCDLDNNKDYQNFLVTLQNKNKPSDQQQSLQFLTNRQMTDRSLNHETYEVYFAQLQFFIEEEQNFFQKETDYNHRKDLKTIKPEYLRIQQKKLFRKDNDNIMSNIEDDNNELIFYLCKSRKHLLNMNTQQQSKLQGILFEHNRFVYIMKQSKNLNQIKQAFVQGTFSQTSEKQYMSGQKKSPTSHSQTQKFANFSQMSQKLLQVNKVGSIQKKSNQFKNKVEEFLYEYHIARQNVLDIDSILEVLVSKKNQSQNFKKQADRDSNQQYLSIAEKSISEMIPQTGLSPMVMRKKTWNNQTKAGRSNNSNLADTLNQRGNIDTILEEVTQSEYSLEQQKVNNTNNNIRELDEDLISNLPQFSQFDNQLKEVDKQYHIEEIINQGDQELFLQQKYIAVFNYFLKMTNSELFTNLSPNYIYYKLDKILKRVSPDYFDYMKWAQNGPLNRWQEYFNHVDIQSKRETDKKLSLLDTGFDNMRYQFSQTFIMDFYIQNLLFQQMSIMDQIKIMIFQNNKNCVRHLIYKEFKFFEEVKQKRKKESSQYSTPTKKPQDEIIQKEFILQKFNDLYYISCQKDDTFKYNIRDQSQRASLNPAGKVGTLYDDQYDKNSSDEEDNKSHQGCVLDNTASRRHKHLKQKITIQQRLMKVQFADASNLDPEDTKYGLVLTEEQLKIQEEQEKIKQAKEMQNKFSLMLGLGVKPIIEEKVEEEEEQLDAEATDRQLMTIQEAKENDRPKKEIYPKFLLCNDFGYCQFIQSDGLYEIYDTQLLKQAEVLYDRKIQKEKQRKTDIAKQREEQIDKYIKQRMSSIFSDKLIQAKNMVKIGIKNDENFKYKEVVNGERGNILVATPINLQAAQENKGMEKFIDPFQSPLILRKRSSESPTDKPDSKTLRSISFGQFQLSVEPSARDEILLDDEDESQIESNQNDPNQYTYRNLQVLKLNLELIGEEDDLSYSQESDTMYSQKTPQIESFSPTKETNDLMISQFNSTQNAKEKFGGIKPMLMIPKKDKRMSIQAMTLPLHSLSALSNMQRRPTMAMGNKNIAENMFKQQFSDRLKQNLDRSIQTINETNKQANVLNTDGLTIHTIVEISSDCDIDHRPEMCRNELKHIKQVHQSNEVDNKERISKIQFIIQQLQYQKNEDLIIEENFETELNKIKEAKQLKEENKIKILQENKQIQSVQQAVKQDKLQSIEKSDVKRINLNRLQIIKMIDGMPRIFRQNDIFTPIISCQTYVQENYQFQYNFSIMNKPQYEYIENYEANDDLDPKQKITYIIANNMPKIKEDPEKHVNQIQINNFIDEFEDLSIEGASLYSGSNEEEEDYIIQVHRIKRKKKFRKQQKNKQDGIDNEEDENLMTESFLFLQHQQTLNHNSFNKQTMMFHQDISSRNNTIKIKSKKSQFKIDTVTSFKDDSEQNSQAPTSQRSILSAEEDEEQKKIKTQKLKEALNKKAEMQKRQNKLKQMMKKKPINFTAREIVEEKPKRGLNLLRKATFKVIEENKIQKEQQVRSNKDPIQLKLRKAIEFNQPQVILDFVLYNGRTVDHYDEEGHTLLTRATHYGRGEIVEILLRKGGADPSLPTSNQDTPLHIAVNYGYKKVQDLLLEFHADESKTNKDGLLPWQGIVSKYPQQQ